MDIKKAIKNRGCSLSDVASKMTAKDGSVGITLGAFSQIVNGNPTLSKLEEIASIVGCSVSELVADEKATTTLSLTCPVCGARLRLTEDVP